VVFLAVALVASGCQELPLKSDRSIAPSYANPTISRSTSTDHTQHNHHHNTSTDLVTITDVTVATSTEEATCVFEPIEPVTETLLQDCCEPNDCTIVGHNHCCGQTKKAINKAYEDVYYDTSAWHLYKGEDCATIGMCPIDRHISTVTCRHNRCELVY
jgi:hypothetical protein